eukprot:3572635-Prymnesium_polylepis.1
MDPTAQAKAQATHQALHHAQDYDRAAAMIPQHKVFPDVLHMYTNEWNDIGHEGRPCTGTSSSRTPTRRSVRAAPGAFLSFWSKPILA